MKNTFNKILKYVVSCFCLILVGSLFFFGCSDSDSKPVLNSDTYSATPIEYSKELATIIFATAYNNSFNQEAYTVKGNQYSFISGFIEEETKTDAYVLKNNDASTTVFYKDVFGDKNDHIVNKVNNVYYDFDMKARSFNTSINNSLQYFLPLKISVKDSVVNGQYINGQDIIYIKTTQLSEEIYIKVVIEDGLILHSSHSYFTNEQQSKIKDYTFVYGIDYGRVKYTVPTDILGWTME